MKGVRAGRWVFRLDTIAVFFFLPSGTTPSPLKHAILPPHAIIPMQLAAAVKRAERAHSREFDALVRSVGECKSKAEEDAILAAETAALKSRLKEGRLDGRAAKEALVRLLYVEMLGGRGAAWGHVRALQACSDANLAIKKVGGGGRGTRGQRRGGGGGRR